MAGASWWWWGNDSQGGQDREGGGNSAFMKGSGILAKTRALLPAVGNWEALQSGVCLSWVLS